MSHPRSTPTAPASRPAGRTPKLAATLAAAGLALTGFAMVSSGAEAGSGASDAARGLVYKGLARATTGPCAGEYLVMTSKGVAVCTHGPDEGPRGVDVTTAKDTLSSTTTTSTASTAPCIGEGTSGQRVQLVYAVASDQPDNYASLLPTLTNLAGQMDSVVNDSAAQTGGTRHIRFVSNPDCTANIAHVVMTATGDDSFNNTISELRAQGFGLSSRKYMAWVDAALYCGIAQVFPDDTAGSTNLSNTSSGYARVDRGCWGRSDHLSEVHELMHTLGGVQTSAPHGTASFHCTDEYDAMCYSDGAGVVMTFPCPSGNEWLLDCNHDDYFSTAPSGGSYLATHWNTADSGFFASSMTDTDAGGTTGPTVSPTVTDSFSGTVTAKKPTSSFPVTTGAGAASWALTFSSTGKTKTAPTMVMAVVDSSGSAVLSGSGPSVLKQAASLAAGTYRWQVSGSSSLSFSLTITHVKG